MLDEEHAVKKDETTDPLAAVEAQGKTMHVKVYAPFKTYFNGDAHSISAGNADGPFDVLPKHHNFMTLLTACDVIVRTDQGDERITISRGIMHVKADDIVVFLDV
jgi:F0F1-type ATP synthase epsilon subunit